MVLPHADDYLNESKGVEEKVVSSYERQESLIEKELKKITKERPSGETTFFADPHKMQSWYA